VSEAGEELRGTPLAAVHAAAGARMVPFAGWSMPVQYRSIVAEHTAVRERAGLFDVSHMGEFFVTGAGAAAYLGRVFSAGVADLAVGRARYGLLPNERGGVVDDVIVYRLAEDRFLVCVNAANLAKDWIWMRGHADVSVELEDASEATALLAVQGPAALAVLASLAPDVAALDRFGVGSISLAGADALVARTGYTGEDGAEIFVAAEAAADLWRALLYAGADAGLEPCGLGARDTLRLEAALPLYGHEIDDETSPFEARLGWTVKLDRPEMVGFAALSRARSEGVARRTIGLRITGGIAREGAAVVRAADGAAVGHVTSGGHGPTVGGAIALALVDKAAASDDLAVEVRGKRRAASVTDLPFYVRHSRNSVEG
jgi:aminomethyltransferase